MPRPVSFAFGVFALPAGWLADKWSRDGMMSVFLRRHRPRLDLHRFRPHAVRRSAGLFVLGCFAAIYHPVGLAIVVEKWKKHRHAHRVNGVWG
jgi:hypothetical protein